MDLKIEHLQNWSPARIDVSSGEYEVDWIYLGDKRFTEPFHDNTLESLLRNPFNLLFRHRTPIACLGELYDGSAGVRPTGFIFHVSRCGSTLVSQMLAALPRNIVISEASVIDKVIRADASEETRVTWLRWLINALGQRRFTEERDLYIKFDSWAVLDLPLIERAFPGVPWIFMYRNPVEVIVSNLRQPGAQMIPGVIDRIHPGLSLIDLVQFSTEERYARTIASFCAAALENAENPRGRFINYNQLPSAVTAEIGSHFGISFSDEDIATMQNSSKRDAKAPYQSFTPDGEAKRNEASNEVMFYAEQLVEPLYRELERIRALRA